MKLTGFHGPLDLHLFHLVNRDGGPVLDLVMRTLSARAFGIAFGLLLCAAVVLRLGRRSLRAIWALALPPRQRPRGIPDPAPPHRAG
jgi:hypothetical protein